VRAEEEGAFDDADDDAGPYVRGDLESHPLHDDRRRLLFSTARCVMHFGSRTHAKTYHVQYATNYRMVGFLRIFVSYIHGLGGRGGK
jgi:hypothetical protein